MFVFVTYHRGWMPLPCCPCYGRGVVYVPGASFHPDAARAETGWHGANTLRLNFVSANERPSVVASAC